MASGAMLACQSDGTVSPPAIRSALASPVVPADPGFFESVGSRRSVRVFQPRAVEEALIERLLSVANSAPSAGNLQAYSIVVVRDAARREQLAAAALGQSFVAEAPVVLVFLSDPARSAQRYGERGAQLFAGQDATIAAAYAQLAAHALGLGSVWVGAFEEEAVRQAVGAPAALVPSSLLPLGYAAERPAATPRRALSDLVRRESFGNGEPW